MYTKQEYEAKRQERYERLKTAARRAGTESESRLNQARGMASVIPFGQPILVGHHSEQRDRNYRSRIENNFRKGYDLYKKSQELESRAESVQDNDAIYSDDPQAVDKLQTKINEAEELQSKFKAVNAAYKKFLKDPSSLDSAPINDTYKALIREYKPEWSGDKPIPSFRLTNNNANIRRLKQRLQVVSKKQAAEDSEEKIDDVRIEYVPTENRIRIFFPARVPLEQYRDLRSHGFRPLRSAGDGAFSAYYNNNALYYIRTKIKGE